jgi:ubiquinone/menaquinone biosynthesis C-methylase UbiE
VTAADSLTEIADRSVDVITTRSVLIYVKDKAAALREFYRVLRSGGRISLFEPINVLGDCPGAGRGARHRRRRQLIRATSGGPAGPVAASR